MIRLILIPAIVLIPLLLPAQTPGHDAVYCQDSIVVRQAPDGALFLLWKAGSNTSVRVMAEATGHAIRDIEALNPILRFRDLQPCDLLMVPVTADQITLDARKRRFAIWYQVRSGETAFSVARRTFNISLEQFMAVNNMSEPALGEGQPVCVGWLQSEQAPAEEIEPDVLTTGWLFTSDEQMDTLDTDSLSASHWTIQKGVAWWNRSKPDPNFFALHRNAPMNSYIEIRNPMFGRSVKAKVIGTIPPTYPEDISVIVSEGVARELGAIDTRFYAEMSYALD